MNPNSRQPTRNRRGNYTQHYLGTAAGRIVAGHIAGLGGIAADHTVGPARIASNTDSAAGTGLVATDHTPARNPAHIPGHHSGPAHTSAHSSGSERQMPRRGWLKLRRFGHIIICILGC